jgi:tetratricopeptide (TPR) repeat protein
MTEATRAEMLKEFLAANPNDSFARYGLAMEYARSGEVENALAEFRRLIEINPDYTAAYQMAAQTLAQAGRTGEARSYFEQGIRAAIRTSNNHARSEMEGMLQELP